MADLIDKQAAIDAVCNCTDVFITNLPTMVYKADVCKALNEVPSAERKKGKWMPSFDGKFTGGAYWFHCSECERIVPEVRNGGWNFCPNCGADMRGAE